MSDPKPDDIVTLFPASRVVRPEHTGVPKSILRRSAISPEGMPPCPPVRLNEMDECNLHIAVDRIIGGYGVAHILNKYALAGMFNSTVDLSNVSVEDFCAYAVPNYARVEGLLPDAKRNADIAALCETNPNLKQAAEVFAEAYKLDTAYLQASIKAALRPNVKLRQKNLAIEARASEKFYRTVAKLGEFEYNELKRGFDLGIRQALGAHGCLSMERR